MFYTIAVLAGLITLEVIITIMVTRSNSETPRRASVVITMATFAMATFVGVWASPVRGSSAEDGLRPFLWFGLMNAVAFVAIMVASRQKYGKPRSSS